MISWKALQLARLGGSGWAGEKKLLGRNVNAERQDGHQTKKAVSGGTSMKQCEPAEPAHLRRFTNTH